ncbi:hypothetical protein D3C76_1546040 [compost metagenome]
MNYGLNGLDVSLPDVLGGQALTIKMAISSGVLSLGLAGCGTAATVLQDDAEAAQGLRRQKTYCQSIPRVYSGLAYDFCVLNAPPDPTGVLVPIILLDLAFCGALDTVVLPYTVYRQGMDGNISVYWRPARG